MKKYENSEHYEYIVNELINWAHSSLNNIICTSSYSQLGWVFVPTAGHQNVKLRVLRFNVRIHAFCQYCSKAGHLAKNCRKCMHDNKNYATTSGSRMSPNKRWRNPSNSSPEMKTIPNSQRNC